MPFTLICFQIGHQQPQGYQRYDGWFPNSEVADRKVTATILYRCACCGKEDLQLNKLEENSHE